MAKSSALGLTSAGPLPRPVTRAVVRVGAMLLARNGPAQAPVRVVAVDGDGQVHFAILPGSVAKNRRLLDRTVA